MLTVMISGILYGGFAVRPSRGLPNWLCLNHKRPDNLSSLLIAGTEVDADHLSVYITDHHAMMFMDGALKPGWLSTIQSCTPVSDVLDTTRSGVLHKSGNTTQIQVCGFELLSLACIPGVVIFQLSVQNAEVEGHQIKK